MIMERNSALAMSLLLVALPASAAPVTVKVLADEVRTIRVSYADLNMTSDAGVRRLMQRVKGAAQAVCEVTYAEAPLSEQMASQTCYDASIAHARADVSLIQQQAQIGLTARGEIAVAQR